MPLQTIASFKPIPQIMPLFRNPATDVSSIVTTFQGTHCEEFEMNFFKCVEAFGVYASKRKCDLEYRDYLECVYERKQRLREGLIRNNRLKQFLSGKIDRPSERDQPMFGTTPEYYSHHDRMPFRQNDS